MADDMIYRQAAIRWVKIECNPYGNPTLDFESGKKVIEHLKQMPSAEPERKTERWIPCSERLPEKHQMVLTTIIGTDVIRMSPGETFEDALARVRNHVRVSVGYIEEYGWYGADGYPQAVKPIAWMPLPKPYNGGKENETD